MPPALPYVIGGLAVLFLGLYLLHRRTMRGMKELAAPPGEYTVGIAKNALADLTPPRANGDRKEG